MDETNELRDPWLVAVWPGMGSVAVLAGSHLLAQLEPRRGGELDVRELFEIRSVDVKEGIITTGQLPRSMIFEWKDPRGGRDLIIFAGEAQPMSGGYKLCQQLIDYAARRGVKHLFTFAAMATALEPGSTPRVFAAATDPAALDQATKLGLEPLVEGQIGGLNGILLAAGVEREIKGTCLLGEMPYFAVNIPNPRAAHAVLQRFTELAGVEIDFSELLHQAESIDEKLVELRDELRRGAAQAAGEEPTEAYLQVEPQEKPHEPSRQRLDVKTQQRIEAMFEDARQDRAKAFKLKEELDRLGVFKEYEDRFLNLFRKAE